MVRLRTSHPGAPGIRRRRSGRGFAYIDASGSVIRDPDVRARIDALVIPPAWQDVWISPDPLGHIQATGVDAAGRKQYLYHADWRARMDRVKFARSLELAASLPRARRGVTRALREAEPTRSRALAAAFRLLDTVAPRVGGERYLQLHGTHGLATLLCGHATVSATGTISLCFPGKSGQEWEAELVDSDLAHVLRSLKRRGADEPLLAWRDGDRWRCLSTEEINADVRERLGADFTAKDFRTLRGGVVASQALARAGAPATATAAKKAISAAVAETASVLGNTPAIARSSYIDPRIIDLYRAGEVARRATGPAAETALRELLGA